MKNTIIEEGAGVFCELCDQRYPGKRPNTDEELKESSCYAAAELEPTSDHVFRSGDTVGATIELRCTRPKNHPGKHVACCKVGGLSEGIWRRIHMQWED